MSAFQLFSFSHLQFPNFRFLNFYFSPPCPSPPLSSLARLICLRHSCAMQQPESNSLLSTRRPESRSGLKKLKPNSPRKTKMKPNLHDWGRAPRFHIAILPLLACLTALAAGASPGANALPGQTIPQSLGFNVHLTGPDLEWDKIQAAGVKFVRKDFDWGGIERTQGQYNFGAYDRMLESLDQHAIRALFILDYRNRLYPEPETSYVGREAFAKWAAESVRHFKGRNVLWEIWNEPNVGFWHGQGGLNSTNFADEYVALVKKAVPAMRAADPDCYILGGSVSCLWRDSFRWIDEAFKEGLLTTGINALSVHPYGFPRPELCLEGGRPTEGYQLLREKMAAAGAPKDFPVLDTEVGYSRTDRNVGPQNLAPEHQAMLFVRTYLLDLMANMQLTIWYNWDGDGGHEVRGGGETNRPVYNACKNLIAELTGYHFSERLPAGSNLDFVLAFENATNGRKIVAWTTPPARDDTPDKAESHEVNIPTGTTGGPVPVHDLYGNAVPARVAGGAVALNLSSSPQYIECTPRAPQQPDSR
jgi:polysaccharide biosynthesis protein PslG